MLSLSDFSCFSKLLTHTAPVMSHIPSTSLPQLYEPLPVLDPGCLCHSAANHVNGMQCPLVASSVKDPAVPVFVCLICQAHIHLFTHSFIYPSIRHLVRPTINYRYYTRHWGCKGDCVLYTRDHVLDSRGEETHR